jgi:hypothetical protein
MTTGAFARSSRATGTASSSARRVGVRPNSRCHRAGAGRSVAAACLSIRSPPRPSRHPELQTYRGQALILPACQDDGCSCSRDVPVLPASPRAGTPRRKTAHPGPSPAGEWMISGSEHSLKSSQQYLFSSDLGRAGVPAPTSPRRTTRTTAAFPEASITLPPRPKCVPSSHPTASIAAIFQAFRAWSQPGSNRRPPACKADQFVHSCLAVSRKALQI